MANKQNSALKYKICIPNTARDYFEYYSPETPLKMGVRVTVPFRKSERIGICVGINDKAVNYPVKSITNIIDDKPIFPEELLTLCQWVSDYYQSPLSEVLPLALPKKYRQGLPQQLPKIKSYKLTTTAKEALPKIAPTAKKQRALIQFLDECATPVAHQALIRQGFTTAQINTLSSKEIISIEETVFTPHHSVAKNEKLQLNADQQNALDAISNQLNHYQCFLLQGVTGSGKTEVYLQVIDKVLKQQKQALVLVPEIGLTPQLLKRFSERFSEPMVVLHSNLNDSERQEAWQLAYDGIARLIIGTRTAVFTPLPQLGLIIIDEEHDPSLKQMDGVRYSARDTALMRAHNNDIPIILGSATPSLESMNNCLTNKYQLMTLPNRAVSTTPLSFQILDIRSAPLKHGLAEQTLQLIKKHLNDQNQVLVFINRRGFSPVVLCHQCGWMADCKACDTHLTYHQSINRLICHHCGLAQSIPTSCQSCNSHELIPIGVGTQRVHEYLEQVFPETKILRVDRDATRGKHGIKQHLDDIASGKAQLIVGTQMLAKGHHFPRLTCVIILDADNGFYNQDFRAIERLGQLITQVAGRAGREEQPGEVLIQTHLPHHPMLTLLIKEGYDAFAKALLAERKEAGLPPAQYMAVIRAQSKNLPTVLRFLNQTKQEITNNDIITMGPAPAPLARKANYHRMQLMIKSNSRKSLRHALTQFRAWLTINNNLNGIRYSIDVDPMDLS